MYKRWKRQRDVSGNKFVTQRETTDPVLTTRRSGRSEEEPLSYSLLTKHVYLTLQQDKVWNESYPINQKHSPSLSVISNSFFFCPYIILARILSSSLSRNHVILQVLVSLSSSQSNRHTQEMSLIESTFGVLLMEDKGLLNYHILHHHDVCLTQNNKYTITITTHYRQPQMNEF